MKPAHTLDEILSFYGNIFNYIGSDRKLDSVRWERDVMGFAALPEKLPVGWAPEKRISRFQCNKAVVTVFEDTFYEIHRSGLWPELHTFDGCFNYRPQRVNEYRLSTHAWGIAVDLNAATNALGASPTIHPGVVRIFKAAGFVWGGDFSKPDGMHFQFCTGY